MASVLAGVLAGCAGGSPRPYAVFLHEEPIGGVSPGGWKTLHPTKVINWVGGLGGSVNLRAHHTARLAWWCARNVSHTLNLKL